MVEKGPEKASNSSNVSRTLCLGVLRYGGRDVNFEQLYHPQIIQFGCYDLTKNITDLARASVTAEGTFQGRLPWDAGLFYMSSQNI